MSPFMSSMPPPGLIEMPPESNTTPLPMKATGWSAGLAAVPAHDDDAALAPEPCPTPSSARMPSFSIAFSSRISTSTPSFVERRGAVRELLGPSTFGGSLTRSRAMMTPCGKAVAQLLRPSCAAAGSATAERSGGSSPAVARRPLLGLVAVEAVARAGARRAPGRRCPRPRVEPGQLRHHRRAAARRPCRRSRRRAEPNRVLAASFSPPMPTTTAGRPKARRGRDRHAPDLACP